MYPAHIRETGERQTVQEHCRNTAALAAAALRPLGLEKSAYLAGLLHDAGKNKQLARRLRYVLLFRRDRRAAGLCRWLTSRPV